MRSRTATWNVHGAAAYVRRSFWYRQPGRTLDETHHCLCSRDHPGHSVRLRHDDRLADRQLGRPRRGHWGVIGSLSGDAGKGALIGAGAGAVGGLIYDQNQRNQQNNQNYRYQDYQNNQYQNTRYRNNQYQNNEFGW
ncbi:MAG TPA: glycine zipper domain-containing protein [Lamprocystis sp. (in: g-proteobacteria)]|nr:glycine zipper domain-containing protein [Lamprocystis sp. (in: g-proteobacteria)]